jgi:tRNA uridine 5-carboxymethylaminomethyl modification enzyme
VRRKQEQLIELRDFAQSLNVEGIKLHRWLKRPESFVKDLPEEIRTKFHMELWEQFEIDSKYTGYIARQNLAIKHLQSQEERNIPKNIDYSVIRGLRPEAQQKLQSIRPATLGHASRVSGVTPADLALLMTFTKNAL